MSCVYEDQTRSCVICLEEFIANDKRTQLPNCSHVVHSSCFFKYVNHNLNNRINQVACPICREVCVNVNSNVNASASANVNASVNASSIVNALNDQHRFIALHVDHTLLPEMHHNYETEDIREHEQRIRSAIPKIMAVITIANLLFLFHLIINNHQ